MLSPSVSDDSDLYYIDLYTKAVSQSSARPLSELRRAALNDKTHTSSVHVPISYSLAAACLCGQSVVLNSG